jgi:RND family efflux transporter MFP subunit
MKKIQLKPAAIAAIAVGGLAIAVVLYSMMGSGASEKAKPVVRPALTVTAVAPRQVSMPIKLAANGNIMAWQEAIVGAEAAGLRLTQVHVGVGDSVRKGQVLATLGGDTLRAEVAQARASLAEAEAAAADAVNNAQRARTLEGTGALSASQITQYLTAEKTAQAKVEAARALVQAQQVRLTQAEVYAPDSGIISARAATVGAVVGNGAELFRLIRQGPAGMARRSDFLRARPHHDRHDGPGDGG